MNVYESYGDKGARELMEGKNPGCDPIFEWIRYLLEHGWTKGQSETLWFSPDGQLYRGPYGAYQEALRRESESPFNDSRR